MASFSAGASQLGRSAFELARELWPICRSITGNGVRETLGIIRRELPGLAIHEVPTGTRCFDWTVPDEWNIRGAHLIGPDGRKILDFEDSNLHVVSYSEPVDLELDLQDLQPHLHSIPEQPDAIPYVTSYYKRSWGLCLPDRVRRALPDGIYSVRIDSDLRPGSLTYGEFFLPGESEDEVLLSTYVCHPSMANNELSGPCVATELGRWLSRDPRRLSYRILFVPETIGAICYLSRHLEHLKAHVIAGFVLTCVGDERAWSFMPSRNGRTVSDHVALHALHHLAPSFKPYSFLERGSDERQYCSPGVDLPVCSVMRSKYMTFPEYHTSLDNLEFITPSGLGEAVEIHQRMIEILEGWCRPAATVLGEPKMSDRGLRPTTGKLGSAEASRKLMDLLAYADGRISLLDIADTIGVPAWELRGMAEELASYDLLRLE